jgi:hypothetical protein
MTFLSPLDYLSLSALDFDLQSHLRSTPTLFSAMCHLSLFFLSFSLLATSFPTQRSSAVFCVKSVNAQLHASLNILILPKQCLGGYTQK